jgi:hypothetical protein
MGLDRSQLVHRGVAQDYKYGLCFIVTISLSYRRKRLSFLITIVENFSNATVTFISDIIQCNHTFLHFNAIKNLFILLMCKQVPFLIHLFAATRTMINMCHDSLPNVNPPNGIWPKVYETEKRMQE